MPNKITADLRAMILNALDSAGGEAYLAEQARSNPSPARLLIVITPAAKERDRRDRP